MTVHALSWESFWSAVEPRLVGTLLVPRDHALRPAPAVLASRGRVAPGPPALGPMGNLAELAADPPGFLTQSMEKYGDVVRFRVGPYSVYLVSHPDGVRQVLQDPHHRYSKQTLGFGRLRQFLGNGLVTDEGEDWRKQRRIAAPAFHRERIAALGGMMCTAVQETADSWEAAARAGQTVDVSAEMLQLTLQIAAETMCGADVREDVAALSEAFEIVLEEVKRKTQQLVQAPEGWPTPANRRFSKAVGTLDDVVMRIIKKRRAAPTTAYAGAGPEGAELLTMLMEARDEDTGEGMSDRQLRDEVMTIFLAGHETTAHALTWTFYLLSRAPEVERRLAAELETVLGGRPPTVADLPRLPLTLMVIKEALRLYPPAWLIDRAAVTDDEIGGYAIPAGSLILISPYVSHRRAEYWPQPEGFDPDRFDPKLPEPNRHAYFPFGAGARICIGNAFAMMEAQLAVATLAQRVSLTCVSGQHIVPTATITLRPSGKVMMRPRLRGQRGDSGERAA